MDTVFLERARAKQAERQQQGKGDKPAFPTTVSTVPMSKGLFKQLFGRK